MRRLVILVSLSTGGLLWAQNVGIGTASPSEKLHVSGNLRLDGAFMPGNQAGTKGAILRSDGANNPPIWVAPTADGQVLISTTSGTDYLPTWTNGNGLFWRLTGNSGTDIATNFIGTTDNVGLAFRTNNVERMRITNDGHIFGRFRHVSYHKFHNATWTGNPANTILWFAAGGGDATDDIQVNSALPVGGPGAGSEARAQWVVPYNGRIVRVIVRIGDASGSNPTIRTRGLVLSRNGSLLVINPTGFCLSQDQYGVYECTQNCDVSRGDRVGIGFDLRNQPGCCDGSCYAEDTHYWVAVVWAFDMWD